MSLLEAGSKLKPSRSWCGTLESIGVSEYQETIQNKLRLRKKVLDENARKRSEKSRAIKFLEE